MTQKVFIALQDNDSARYIVEAIVEDNPHADIQYEPAMIRIEAEKKIIINRKTMEEKLGREWDIQEMLIDVISIGGGVEEDDDRFILQWN